jgi:hypothetical protein
MKYSCRRCGQGVEADENVAIADLICPSCGEPLVRAQPSQADAPPHQPIKRIWIILILISLAASLVAVVIAIFKPHIAKPIGMETSSTDPKEAARRAFEFGYRNNGFVLDYKDFFQKKHQNEILKTFEIADVQIHNHAAIAFERYSVGSLIFRESQWLWQSDDKWYPVMYLPYDYPPENSTNMPWFQEMRDRESKWNKDTAAIYQD